MFCHKCGKEIDNDAVVCVYCGVETKNMTNKNTPINIVNQSSSSASSSATSKVVVRRHSLFFDLIMICLTGGLWIFWMLIR